MTYKASSIRETKYDYVALGAIGQPIFGKLSIQIIALLIWAAEGPSIQRHFHRLASLADIYIYMHEKTTVLVFHGISNSYFVDSYTLFFTRLLHTINQALCYERIFIISSFAACY